MADECGEESGEEEKKKKNKKNKSKFERQSSLLSLRLCLLACAVAFCDFRFFSFFACPALCADGCVVDCSLCELLVLWPSRLSLKKATTTRRSVQLCCCFGATFIARTHISGY